MNHDQVDIKTPEYVSLQFQTAGLGSRAAAMILDQLIIMAFNIAVVLILVLTMNFTLLNPYGLESNTIPLAIVIIILFVINWGYFFALEYFWAGKTIGKKVVGIRVIQDNGQSITVLSSLIRNLLRIVDSLPAYYFVGMIMVFFHSKHKRLGDVVAGTIVVHERKKKSKKKRTAFEKEVARRGLTAEDYDFEEWAIKQMSAKDWNLIKTYCQRYLQLNELEKVEMTKQIAEIFFSKLGIEMAGKTQDDLETILFVLYLQLRDEWEFQL